MCSSGSCVTTHQSKWFLDFCRGWLSATAMNANSSSMGMKHHHCQKVANKSLTRLLNVLKLSRRMVDSRLASIRCLSVNFYFVFWIITLRKTLIQLQLLTFVFWIATEVLNNFPFLDVTDVVYRITWQTLLGTMRHFSQELGKDKNVFRRTRIPWR